MPKCRFDMYSLSKEARLSVLLKAAKHEGVDRSLAIAFIALCEGETGYAFLTHRPYPPLTEIQGSSDCCAVPVGIELAYFDSGLRQSPKTLSFLAQKGWLKTENGVLKPTNGLGNPLKPWKTMAAFEFAYLAEEDAAIKIFAVGPFQMNMKWNGASCGFPANRDEIWDLYVAGRDMELQTTSGWSDDQIVLQIYYSKIAYLIERWGRYNLPKDVNPQGEGCKPATTELPNGNPAGDIAWLTGHAGNPSTASKLYYGTLSPTRAAYKDVWANVNAKAAAMGY